MRIHFLQPMRFIGALIIITNILYCAWDGEKEHWFLTKSLGVTPAVCCSLSQGVAAWISAHCLPRGTLYLGGKFSGAAPLSDSGFHLGLLPDILVALRSGFQSLWVWFHTFLLAAFMGSSCLPWAVLVLSLKVVSAFLAVDFLWIAHIV